MLADPRIKLMAFAIALSLAQGAASPAARGPLDELRTLDGRLVAVGTRLAIANVSLCDQRQYQPGLSVHDLSQYERGERAAVAAAFGLVDGPGVLALAPSGSAARAGLLLDDNIIAADGTPLPRPSANSPASYAPTEQIVTAIEAAFADGVATFEIRRRGQPMTIRVAADLGCASRFHVSPSDRLTARADGRYVLLTSAMVAFMRDDDELAASVAHELAHNILRHRARLNAAGVDRGLLSRFGRSGRLFRQTELEADRLAVHLMARAGYDPEAAVRLAIRQSQSDSRLFAGTHPNWPTRLAAMRAEIGAIMAARERGEIAEAPLPRGPLTAGRD